MTGAEQITGPVTYHGEGPVWSEHWDGLRWVDMLAGDVLRLTPGGEVKRSHVGEVAAALRPRAGGGAVIGVERGFALEDGDGAITQLGDLWADPGVRMNEGACDPHGRFYCGSMARDKRPGAGTLFRLDPDGATSVVLEGVTVSNGLDWSPDGTRAYYNDTDTHRTDVFDYARETGLTNRRALVEHGGEQQPDGLTVDAEGGIWVAMNGAGEVHRYNPEGKLEGTVELPVAQVTACAFGGPDLATLFITTSREDLPADAEPQAGSLFGAHVAVSGLPVREFAG